MIENFVQALAWVLSCEGGFVNHPKDPGGATNCGITQKTYDHYRMRVGLPARTVAKITAVEVEAIYREGYWRPLQGDALPGGLDYVLFDTAVLCGPGKAAEWLKGAIARYRAGDLPKLQLTAVNGKALPTGRDRVLIDLILEQRRTYLESRPHAKTFIRGWVNRVELVRKRAYQLVR